MDEPTRATIDACRRGDRQALESVLRDQAPALERLFARLTGSSAEIEDLLQATFVAAIRAFPRFRGEASVRTWLARIAVGIFQESLRRSDRRLRARLTVVRDDDAADERLPDQQADARRRLSRIFSHLENVAPKKRIAFLLHVVDGRPIEEVAALMGASRPATKSRVFWARRELVAKVRRDPMLRELISKDGEL
jgi:RNA polymerase sigma factor (sigma-70 family)